MSVKYTIGHLDLTLDRPEENLACDEALLDACERGSWNEVLRFWESPVPFVVVGYANSVAREVNMARCQALNIPILRRCTGGGAVVQGPGCLNYSLVLRVNPIGPLQNIPAANRHIMDRNRAAVSQVMEKPVAVNGFTDLTIDGIKFSGNSQRRRRNALLFHGSFLLHFDLDLISDLLPPPSKEPDYRKGRAHRDFLTNLGVPAEVIKDALRDVWNARTAVQEIPFQSITDLARERYATDAWNFRF
jgi:lipoate-protein ligase A